MAGLQRRVLCDLGQFITGVSAKPDMTVSELRKQCQWCDNLCREVGLVLVDVADEGELKGSEADS